MITKAASIDGSIKGTSLMSAHAIYCKFLTNRVSYVPCHVQVPDVPQRLSAIALDGRFYSFFKVINEAQKLLSVISRLGKQDDEVAVTPTPRGYILWVYEPQATYAPPFHAPHHSLKPAFGPPPCLILSEPSSYSRCTLIVPDIAKPITGLVHAGKYYSIFRQETNAANSMTLTAKLTQRQDETLMVIEPDGFILAIREPNAVLMV